MEQTVYPSLCSSTQHPLINSYSWCPAFFLQYFYLRLPELSRPSYSSMSLVSPLFLNYSCPSLQFSHISSSPVTLNSFHSQFSLPCPFSPSHFLPLPLCSSSPRFFSLSLSLFYIYGHPFLSFPSPSSLPLSFPCCLSSLACTTVSASKAIKQWEFSTQQMCWMDGRMSRRGWRWAAHKLDAWRREDNLHLFHVRNVTEHSFF